MQETEREKAATTAGIEWTDGTLEEQAIRMIAQAKTELREKRRSKMPARLANLLSGKPEISPSGTWGELRWSNEHGELIAIRQAPDRIMLAIVEEERVLCALEMTPYTCTTMSEDDGALVPYGMPNNMSHEVWRWASRSLQALKRAEEHLQATLRQAQVNARELQGRLTRYLQLSRTEKEIDKGIDAQPPKVKPLSSTAGSVTPEDETPEARQDRDRAERTAKRDRTRARSQQQQS